jgi:hypothetical protein
MELEIFKWIAYTLLGVAVYLLKRTIDDLDKNLLDHKVTISNIHNDVQNVRTEYLHKNDFKDFKVELRNMFEDLRQDIKALRKE